MKSIPLREAKQQLSEYVLEAQKERILITKHGKPAALIWGVAGHDLEDIFYMTNPGFWKMIRRRRNQKGIPWSEAKKKR